MNSTPTLGAANGPAPIWDIRLIHSGSPDMPALTLVSTLHAGREATGRGQRATRAQRVFYSVFLPLGIVANLCLGLVILTGLKPESWSEWLQIATGAFCCVVAGWLTAAAWSRSYWIHSMARQVAVWRGIADIFFTWLEDAPLPADSLRALQSSLDEVVADPIHR